MFLLQPVEHEANGRFTYFLSCSIFEIVFGIQSVSGLGTEHVRVLNADR